MRLIDADALYKRTAEWEAQAQMQLESLTKMRLQDMNRAQRDEFIKWSAVLAERSAFKFDIADAPTVEPKIVRCAECKNMRIIGRTTMYYSCELWECDMDATDYCSRGERRADDGNL